MGLGESTCGRLYFVAREFIPSLGECGTEKRDKEKRYGHSTG